MGVCRIQNSEFLPSLTSIDLDTSSPRYFRVLSYRVVLVTGDQACAFPNTGPGWARVVLLVATVARIFHLQR